MNNLLKHVGLRVNIIIMCRKLDVRVRKCNLQGRGQNIWLRIREIILGSILILLLNIDVFILIILSYLISSSFTHCLLLCPRFCHGLKLSLLLNALAPTIWRVSFLWIAKVGSKKRNVLAICCLKSPGYCWSFCFQTYLQSISILLLDHTCSSWGRHSK